MAPWMNPWPRPSSDSELMNFFFLTSQANFSSKSLFSWLEKRPINLVMSTFYSSRPDFSFCPILLFFFVCVTLLLICTRILFSYSSMSFSRCTNAHTQVQFYEYISGEFTTSYWYSIFFSYTNFKSLGHWCHWTTTWVFFFKIATHVTKKTTLKWFKHQL